MLSSPGLTSPCDGNNPPKTPKSPFPVLLEVVCAPRRAVTEGCHSTAATYWHLQLVQLQPALKNILVTMKKSRSVNTSSAYLFACSGSFRILKIPSWVQAELPVPVQGAAPDWREGDRVTSTILKKINLCHIPQSQRLLLASLLYFLKIPQNR